MKTYSVSPLINYEYKWAIDCETNDELVGLANSKVIAVLIMVWCFLSQREVLKS